MQNRGIQGFVRNNFFIKGIVATMFSDTVAGALSKKRFNRIISAVCTVSIIASFLFTAFPATQLSETKNASASGCLRTRNPICTCEKDTNYLLLSGGLAQTIIQSRATNEKKPVCVSCATILKNLNPLKVQSFINSSIVFADVFTFSSAALIVCLLIPESLDPVTLRAKLNN